MIYLRKACTKVAPDNISNKTHKIGKMIIFWMLTLRKSKISFIIVDWNASNLLQISKSCLILSMQTPWNQNIF